MVSFDLERSDLKADSTNNVIAKIHILKILELVFN